MYISKALLTLPLAILKTYVDKIKSDIFKICQMLIYVFNILYQYIFKPSVRRVSFMFDSMYDTVRYSFSYALNNVSQYYWIKS